MGAFTVRDYRAEDAAAILEINAANVPEVGDMDASKLGAFAVGAAWLPVVEVDGEVVGVRPVGECAEFGGGVDGAEFGGLREGERADFRGVDAVPAEQERVEVGGTQLAVGGDDREQFAAAGEKFGCGALVGFDVGECVAEDAVVALAEGGEGEGEEGEMLHFAGDSWPL